MHFCCDCENFTNTSECLTGKRKNHRTGKETIEVIQCDDNQHLECHRFVEALDLSSWPNICQGCCHYYVDLHGLTQCLKKQGRPHPALLTNLKGCGEFEQKGTFTERLKAMFSDWRS